MGSRGHPLGWRCGVPASEGRALLVRQVKGDDLAVAGVNLEAGGTLENAQAMAAHESTRTTKLYDRTGDEITLDEVERITI
jgi:hypothetical protein